VNFHSNIFTLMQYPLVQCSTSTSVWNGTFVEMPILKLPVQWFHWHSWHMSIKC